MKEKMASKYENIEREQQYDRDDDREAASLKWHPFTFGNSRNSVRGIYIYGLEGMGSQQRELNVGGLIESFCREIYRMEYAFLFVAPGQGDQPFFHAHGFVNGFYRNSLNYVSGHDFRREFENSISDEPEEEMRLKKERFAHLVVSKLTSDNFRKGDPGSDSELKELIDRICIFIHNGELQRGGMQLIHSLEDLRDSIGDCLAEDGMVFVASDQKEDITAVAFTRPGAENNVIVYYAHVADSESRYRILEEISAATPDKGMCIWRYPVHSYASGLWQPYYGASLPEAPLAGAVGESERGYYPVSHSEVYGMARILNLHEILKFQAGERRDLKYSILIKEGAGPRFMRYRAKDGEVEREDLTDSLSDKEKIKVLMTFEDMAEILFRRPDSDPIVEAVMELPPLGASIAMLPGGR